MPRRRRVPGWRRTCPKCGEGVVFARTLAGPNGPGGKAMPLNEYEDPGGNVAARQVAPSVAVCRSLAADDSLDRDTEVRAMPHFATCKPTEAKDDLDPIRPPEGVVYLDAFRKRRKRTTTG